MSAKAATLVSEAHVLAADRRLCELFKRLTGDLVVLADNVLSELSEMGLATTECALQLRRLRDDVDGLAVLERYLWDLARLLRGRP